ncbi:hypothetical protein FB451DRAFT_1419613 [Mycena latifolia]|nr:hypothetical protein FB451DRAFT_1419613 [Mycena latifolia]
MVKSQKPSSSAKPAIAPSSRQLRSSTKTQNQNQENEAPPPTPQATSRPKRSTAGQGGVIERNERVGDRIAETYPRTSPSKRRLSLDGADPYLDADIPTKRQKTIFFPDSPNSQQAFPDSPSGEPLPPTHLGRNTFGEDEYAPDFRQPDENEYEHGHTFGQPVEDEDEHEHQQGFGQPVEDEHGYEQGFGQPVDEHGYEQGFGQPVEDEHGYEQGFGQPQQNGSMAEVGEGDEPRSRRDVEEEDSGPSSDSYQPESEGDEEHDEERRTPSDWNDKPEGR